MGFTPTLQATSHGGEVNLHGFTSLTYSKEQHGDFISLASRTQPIAEVWEKVKELRFDKTCEDTARTLDVTVDELFDVIRYYLANPPKP